MPIKGQPQTSSETLSRVMEIATGQREKEFKSEEPKIAVLRPCCYDPNSAPATAIAIKSRDSHDEVAAFIKTAHFPRCVLPRHRGGAPSSRR
jgi:hypothetical protein